MESGEYIHLTARNYRLYGINRASHGSNGVSAAVAIKMAKEKIQKQGKSIQISSALKLKGIEKKINNQIDEFRIETKSRAISNNEEYLNKIILSSIKNAFANIDFSTLDISVAESKIKTITRANMHNSNLTNEMINKIKQINLATEKLKKGITDVDRFNQIPQLEKKLEMVRKLCQDNYAELRKIINSSLGVNISKEEKNIVRTINYLIENYVPLVDIARAKQNLAKGVVELAFAKGNEIGRKKFVNRIDQIKYGKDFFVKGMIEKGKIDVNTEDQIGDSLIRTIHTSSQSMRVEFQYYKKNQALIKNIDLAPGWKTKGQEITFAQGKTILDFLQDENADFVNHYFNLYTEHEGQLRSVEADKKAAMEAIKMISLYKALTGDSYGKGKKAELFILIDSKSKKSHVKVYSIYSILDRVDKYLDNYAFFKGEVFKSSFLYKNDRVKGRWARTGTQRIAKVLNQAHQMQIAVGINSRMLSKL